jgi:pSer/pThr/pTyr-binding forkhead associated (FHA) protein
MTVGLLVLSPGKWQGQVIPLTRSPFVIGRDPRCQLRPASSEIDERHCAIVWQEGKAYLRDLDSSSGTYLNGKRIQGQKPLANEDRVNIGHIEFSMRIATAVCSERGTKVHSSLSDTMIDTTALPPSTHVEKGNSGRRRTTSEAAGNLLSKYMKRH